MENVCRPRRKTGRTGTTKAASNPASTIDRAQPTRTVEGASIRTSPADRPSSEVTPTALSCSSRLS